MAEPQSPPRHYIWAGMDFILDHDGTPVLLEANKSSHMLGEYLEFCGDDRPFQLAAEVMNAADGPPCLLWRRGEPFPDADEDACWIGAKLTKYLRETPIVCDVEDNQDSPDKSPGSVGFSPRGSVISQETWAEAHATSTFVGRVQLVQFARSEPCQKKKPLWNACGRWRRKSPTSNVAWSRRKPRKNGLTKSAVP